MKKSILVLLVMLMLGSFAFAAGQFSISPKMGYGVLDFDYEVTVADDSGAEKKVRQATIEKGFSIGLDGNYLVNPKLSVFLDGEFILPFHFVELNRDDGKILNSGVVNRKFITDTYDDASLFGYKFNLGVMYSLFEDGRIKLAAGGGLGIEGATKNYTEKDTKVKHEETYLGVGLALKAVGNYSFSDKVALYVAFQPDLILYSKSEQKTGGVKNESIGDGGLCFRFAPTTSVGATFMF